MAVASPLYLHILPGATVLSPSCLVPGLQSGAATALSGFCLSYPSRQFKANCTLCATTRVISSHTGLLWSSSTLGTHGFQLRTEREPTICKSSVITTVCRTGVRAEAAASAVYADEDTVIKEESVKKSSGYRPVVILPVSKTFVRSVADFLVKIRELRSFILCEHNSPLKTLTVLVRCKNAKYSHLRLSQRLLDTFACLRCLWLFVISRLKRVIIMWHWGCWHYCIGFGGAGFREQYSWLQWACGLSWSQGAESHRCTGIAPWLVAKCCGSSRCKLLERQPSAQACTGLVGSSYTLSWCGLGLFFFSLPGSP